MDSYTHGLDHPQIASQGGVTGGRLQAPAPMPEVERAVGNLDAAATQLLDRLEVLAMRVQSVTRPVEPTIDSDTVSEPWSTDLGSRINGITERIAIATRTVESLSARVEL